MNKDIKTINQLQEIKKNYMRMDEGSRNVSSKKVAALNNSIRAVKKYHKSQESFWSGFIVCAIMFIVYSLIFSSFR